MWPPLSTMPPPVISTRAGKQNETKMIVAHNAHILEAMLGPSKRENEKKYLILTTLRSADPQRA